MGTNFNSAKGGRSNMCTREGCDYISPRKYVPFIYFNPRTRAGCDALPATAGRRLHNFNPRTRAGCDRKLTQKYAVVCAFNIPSRQTLVNFLAVVLSSFLPRPFILPFLSANLAGNSRPLGVRTAPKGGKSCDILRAASPPFLSSISDKLFRKKANQNRVCQLKRERPARKRPVSASPPQPIPKSRRGVFKPFLPISQPGPIPAASRPFILAPGERPGRWPFPKRPPRPGGLAHGRGI